MKALALRSLACAALGASAMVALAAPGGTIVAQESSCQKEVKDYLNAVQFIRQSSGADIGGKVAQAYVSEKDLSAIVAQRGYCVAAQVLRDKGTPR